jgi:hypothetical protein
MYDVHGSEAVPFLKRTMQVSEKKREKISAIEFFQKYTYGSLVL